MVGGVKAINEWIAVRVSNGIATMTCAYVFAVIAIIALPQAWQDSFATGFHPLPLVTWLSQSFLQLVLLSIIMVGQDCQSRGISAQAAEQHAAVMEILRDEREERIILREMMTAMREVLADVRKLVAPPV